ncbi:hypothetical protein Bpla01_66340 [Burkholderia plantarii]|nr:hypothetical protein Bpla01_66340 [Burkholderia plantarii]
MVNGTIVAQPNANPNGYLVVPEGYSIDKAENFSSSINAILYEGGAETLQNKISAYLAMFNAFKAGGPQDLQRSYPTSDQTNQSFVTAFRDAASFHIGFVGAASGIGLLTVETAGGLYNAARGIINKNINSHGLFGNNPLNAKSMIAGALVAFDVNNTPFSVGLPAALSGSQTYTYDIATGKAFVTPPQSSVADPGSVTVIDGATGNFLGYFESGTIVSETKIANGDLVFALTGNRTVTYHPNDSISLIDSKGHVEYYPPGASVNINADGPSTIQGSTAQPPQIIFDPIGAIVGGAPISATPVVATFSNTTATAIASSIYPNLALAGGDPNAQLEVWQNAVGQERLTKLITTFFGAAVPGTLSVAQDGPVLNVWNATAQITSDPSGQMTATLVEPSGQIVVEVFTNDFVPVSKSFFDTSGRMTSEILFDPEGHPSETDTFTYGPDGTFLGSNAVGSTGSPKSTTTVASDGTTVTTTFNSPSDPKLTTVTTIDPGGDVTKTVQTVAGSSPGSYTTTASDGEGEPLTIVATSQANGVNTTTTTTYGPVGSSGGGWGVVGTNVESTPSGTSGATTIDVYDGDGNHISHKVIAANGATVQTTFNNPADPKQTSIVSTAPDGTVLGVTTTTQSSDGSYVTTATANGQTTTSVSTNGGQLESVSVRQPDGSTTTTTYSTPGNTTLGSVVTTAANGGVVSTTTTVEGALPGSTITITVDPTGKPISESLTTTGTDPDGVVTSTTTTYDANGQETGRVSTATDPSGTTTTTSYDANNDPQSVTVTQPDGSTTKTSFDAGDPNQSTSVSTAPDGSVQGTSSTTKDSNGNDVTTSKSADGTVTTTTSAPDGFDSIAAANQAANGLLASQASGLAAQAGLDTGKASDSKLPPGNGSNAMGDLGSLANADQDLQDLLDKLDKDWDLPDFDTGHGKSKEKGTSHSGGGGGGSSDTPLGGLGGSDAAGSTASGVAASTSFSNPGVAGDLAAGNAFGAAIAAMGSELPPITGSAGGTSGGTSGGSGGVGGGGSGIDFSYNGSGFIMSTVDPVTGDAESFTFDSTGNLLSNNGDALAALLSAESEGFAAMEALASQAVAFDEEAAAIAAADAGEGGEGGEGGVGGGGGGGG